MPALHRVTSSIFFSRAAALAPPTLLTMGIGVHYPAAMMGCSLCCSHWEWMYLPDSDAASPCSPEPSEMA
ncbi:hypothetical protein EYF80_022468 [Liparis tanakae]|uniref:Secreted protein n=1 Tax=Liparis tanakae TaxID=230148 RepID=A0A4Z2HP64_9TELE|nr:hypothetical protein EYF80_022468 [Liparis tanakae]